jgi:hypothetical protein
MPRFILAGIPTVKLQFLGAAKLNGEVQSLQQLHQRLRTDEQLFPVFVGIMPIFGSAGGWMTL